MSARPTRGQPRIRAAHIVSNRLANWNPKSRRRQITSYSQACSTFSIDGSANIERISPNPSDASGSTR